MGRWEVQNEWHAKTGEQGQNRSCCGSVSTNKTWGVFILNWWSTVGEGYIEVGRLGGGKQVTYEGGRNQAKI